MAKSTRREIEVYEFDDIHRGTTFTLPIIIRKSDGTKFDLTGFKAIFTLKPAQSDFDYDDDRGYITKEFYPYTDDPNKIGRIDITLTSKELWQPPGLYYFDIVLMNGASSQRIFLASTHLVGGPTNRNVRHDQDQADFFLHDPIEITPSDRGYIGIQVPFVTDPPENIVEGISGDPKFIVQQLDDPNRHVLIRNYGPRVSLMMTLRVPHDHTNHRYRFDEFFLNNSIPAPCPLKNGYLLFNNRRFEIHLGKRLNAETNKKEERVMDMLYRWTCVQHSPDITYEGNCGVQLSNKPIYIGDNVDSGQMTIQLNGENDQIHITADHYIPDDHFDYEYWMLRIDWFNWVDPWEPDPERDDVSTHFPETNPVADTWEGYWPPDMWYCYHEGKKE